MSVMTKSGQELRFLTYSVHEAGKLVKLSKKKHVWRFLVAGELCEVVASESLLTHSFRVHVNREQLFEAKVSEKQLAAGITIATPGYRLLIRKTEEARFDLSLDDELFTLPAGARVAESAASPDDDGAQVAGSRSDYFDRPAAQLFTASQQPKSLFAFGKRGLELPSVKEIFAGTFNGLFRSKKEAAPKRGGSVAVAASPRKDGATPSRPARPDYASFFFSGPKAEQSAPRREARPADAWWDMNDNAKAAATTPARPQRPLAARPFRSQQALPDLMDFGGEDATKAVKKEQNSALLHQTKTQKAAAQALDAALAAFTLEESLPLQRAAAGPAGPAAGRQRLAQLFGQGTTPLKPGPPRPRDNAPGPGRCENVDPNPVRLTAQLPDKSSWNNTLARAKPSAARADPPRRLAECEADLRCYAGLKM